MSISAFPTRHGGRCVIARRQENRHGERESAAGATENLPREAEPRRDLSSTECQLAGIA